MDEPSVLDFLKAKLLPWRYPPVDSQAGENIVQPALDQSIPFAEEQAQPRGRAWPTWSLSGLLLALFAQRALEPQAQRGWETGVILFGLATGLIGWAALRGEWRVAGPRAPVHTTDSMRVRGVLLIGGLGAALLAFFASMNNLFSPLNLGLLLLSIALLVAAFWRTNLGDKNNRRPVRRSTLLEIAWLVPVLAVAAYYRFARLAAVPGEMNSDHAEKILDVWRVLAGQTSIFFPANGGREALQIYLTAGLVKLFGVELDFLALKIVSAGVGFLMLPFIYMAGKELANRRAGLLAMVFAGLAYWPNVVSRLGLRLPFYFLFTSILFFLLLRGLRRGQRNDFRLLGLVLGLSLYGYSADRVLPLLALAALGLYLLHPPSLQAQLPPLWRRQAVWFTLLAFGFALVVFIPLFHYALEEPQTYLYRSLTRMSGLEQPLVGPAVTIFLRNTGRALAMFFWSNGDTWTASVAFRPALDIASGALFWCGVVVVFITYLKKRCWQHAFLLLAIPILMLPSIMALAFPIENPNLYRTGGAAIPVFLIIGLCLDGLISAMETGKAAPELRAAPGNPANKTPNWARITAYLVGAVLLALSAYQSYDLVFRQYHQQYELNSWNTSEIGQVVRNFSGTIGPVENVWLIGYPYWVDSRLVGIIAGYPLRNFAILAADIKQLPDSAEARLFILNPLDQDGLAAVQQQFTGGVLTTYQSKIPGKEFLIYYVPLEEESSVNAHYSG